MKWTPKQLERLGFENRSWDDEGETFTEYVKDNGTVKVEISGESLVEITQDEANYITVPNCETLNDLKSLLKLFNL